MILIKTIFLFFLSFSGAANNQELQIEKMRKLAAELRCVVCQNQSLLESDSQIAKDLKELILEMYISQKLKNLNLSVHDNGPGIPQEISETIFYPMISGRPDGSGLGLPISHGIVTQHGGMIECECKPGETKFTVTIPIQCKSQFSISKVQQANELK